MSYMYYTSHLYGFLYSLYGSLQLYSSCLPYLTLHTGISLTGHYRECLAARTVNLCDAPAHRRTHRKKTELFGRRGVLLEEGGPLYSATHVTSCIKGHIFYK